MGDTCKITLQELLAKDLLDLNKKWVRLNLDETTECVEQGVYVFKGADDIPLYIGISDNIGRRVSAHLNGWGNKDLYKYPRELIVIEYFKEVDVLFRDIYESYLIHTLNPRYNVSKTNKQRIYK